MQKGRISFRDLETGRFMSEGAFAFKYPLAHACHQAGDSAFQIAKILEPILSEVGKGCFENLAEAFQKFGEAAGAKVFRVSSAAFEAHAERKGLSSLEVIQLLSKARNDLIDFGRELEDQALVFDLLESDGSLEEEES